MKISKGYYLGKVMDYEEIQGKRLGTDKFVDYLWKQIEGCSENAFDQSMERVINEGVKFPSVDSFTVIIDGIDRPDCKEYESCDHTACLGGRISLERKEDSTDHIFLCPNRDCNSAKYWKQKYYKTCPTDRSVWRNKFGPQEIAEFKDKVEKGLISKNLKEVINQLSKKMSF